MKKKIRRRGIFQSTISARRNETENEKGFFPLHSSLIFKYVIRVDYRFGRQVSPAALILENYKSAGENVENVKAMS